MSRVSSSGSPTHCSASLSPLPSSTCRSTQLYAALRVPPTNHLANGGSSQSRTRSHFWSQERRSACFSQKASRSSAASSYQSAVTLACFARSSGGSKRRSSWLRLARVSLDAFSLLTTLISVGDVVLLQLVRKDSRRQGRALWWLLRKPSQHPTRRPRGTLREVSLPTTPTT